MRRARPVRHTSGLGPDYHRLHCAQGPAKPPAAHQLQSVRWICTRPGRVRVTGSIASSPVGALTAFLHSFLLIRAKLRGRPYNVHAVRTMSAVRDGCWHAMRARTNCTAFRCNTRTAHPPRRLAVVLAGAGVSLPACASRSRHGTQGLFCILSPCIMQPSLCVMPQPRSWHFFLAVRDTRMEGAAPAAGLLRALAVPVEFMCSWESRLLLNDQVTVSGSGLLHFPQVPHSYKTA